MGFQKFRKYYFPLKTIRYEGNTCTVHAAG